MSHASSSSGNLRLAVLLGALVVAIAALVYDYKVARVAVEVAHDGVAKMNDAQNVSNDRHATTSEDVQRLLGRKPDRVEIHEPFKVEVYGYMSGIPFRRHNYYAVYVDGAGKSAGKLMFLKQFKFALPLEELEIPQSTGSASAATEPPAGAPMAGGGPPSDEGMKMMSEMMRKKREEMEGKKQSEEGAAAEATSETKGETKGEAKPETKDEPAAEPQPDAPKEDAPKEDAPKEEAKDAAPAATPAADKAAPAEEKKEAPPAEGQS